MIDEIFQQICEHLDKKNEIRESIITKSRTIIQNCGKGIKLVHSRNYEEVKEIITKNEVALTLLSNEIDAHTSELFFKSNIFTAYQEQFELIILYSLITKNEYPSYKYLQAPVDAYLFGLCDAIGELRRFALDSIRRNDIEDSERVLKFIEEIFENLTTLNYPNGLIPNLRHKIDVARVLIERTRGDVTMAWVMLRNKS